jgi:hypothetical protein
LGRSTLGAAGPPPGAGESGPPPVGRVFWFWSGIIEFRFCFAYFN